MTYVFVINLKLYQISCEARNIRNETAMCTNVFYASRGCGESFNGRHSHLERHTAEYSGEKKQNRTENGLVSLN